ncbi:YhgE/Pip domain-containing protein [Clostridium brassicae]|uniref:YhgE/Pip domain-containing protein n=1 Tax=Clostridium brassicae TaxID=2999072 RepID=A0ABT4DBT3_9CLOT|nr:YhgE/Pip domain-containing protein [Clostridium brassicae]MCY6959762.1 YhgE/Pip domain-containing protein [Clostridium brassicae]
MKIFKFTKEEFKAIFNNKIKIVALIAIIIIPLLYSFFYLKAYWDPYGNLDSYPIAIVNQDKGVYEDGQKHNYGNEIINNLKDNKEVGFEFISSEEAKDGLSNDKYFAAFFISENFSEKIVDAKKGKAVQPVIEYVSNDKKNYIGSKISKAVQGEVKEKIKKNISKAYGEAAFKSIYEMRDGMGDAVDGSQKLLDGENKLKDGANQLNNGISKINSNMPELASGFKRLYDGMISMEKGINDPSGLKSGSVNLSQGLKIAEVGSNELSEGILKASNGIDSLYEGILKLNNALNTEEKDKNDKPLGLKNGALALENGVTSLNNVINTQAKDQNGNPLGLKEGMISLNNGINTLNKGVNGDEGLVEAVNKIYEGNKTLSASVDSLDRAFQAYKANPNSETLVQVEYIINALKYNTSQNSKDPSKPTFKDGIDNLKQGTDGLSISIDKALVPASASITKGVGTLASTVNDQVLPATKGVTNGVKQVSNTMNFQVAPGTAQLQTGLQELNKGSQRLNNGVGELYNGSTTMVQGVDTLGNGTTNMKDGMSKFNETIPVLTNGISKLFKGSEEISKGMGKLQSGTEELNDGLNDGIDKVNKNVSTPSKELGEFVGEPIKVNENVINPVPNYGTGLAPYFLPISSWLGAVFMFFVLKSKRDNAEEYNSAERVLGSYFTYAILGIIQAIALGVVVLGLGIKPSNIPMLFVINVFMSLCFVAIIQCFTSLLGLAGEGLAIIVLVLQLCSDAGTFPIETLPEFFKNISGFLPFTYCVQMIREVLSATSINYSLVIKDISMLIIFALVFMMVNMIFNKKGQAISETLEEKLAS